MDKDKKDEKLEYYTAQKAVGQIPASQSDIATASKSSSRDAGLKSKADGYVAMKESGEKQREFERYKEITFSQKASEKAKQNPLIPYVDS